MEAQKIFKRYEYKYMLTLEQLAALRELMEQYMIADAFGRSTICNLYFDTPQYLLIRRSIENHVYKEKIRLRTYGQATPDTTAFIELKKKYKKVVYKRRISARYENAMQYLCQRAVVFPYTGSMHNSVPNRSGCEESHPPADTDTAWHFRIWR